MLTVSGIGGGRFFFALHPVLPPLIDSTGPVTVPRTFSEVPHDHSFAQNTLAAFISWLLLPLNWIHQSTVEIR